MKHDKKAPESMDRRRWLNEPYTQQMARVAAKTRAERLSTLLNVCRESPDPRARVAVAEYDQARADADFLGADGEFNGPR